MTTYVEEKTRLLRELKAEMLNQLAAVQAEDPEEFLRGTERSRVIIESINILDSQQVPPPENPKMELVGLLQEIDEVSQQISTLIPSLQEKLKHLWMAEKQSKTVKRRYKQEDFKLPSIFFDKKI